VLVSHRRFAVAIPALPLPMKIATVLALWALSCVPVVLHAQATDTTRRIAPIVGQIPWLANTYAASAAFEGTITWVFKVRGGELSEQLREVNPINSMTMHIQNGNYIIHLYANQQRTDQVGVFAEPHPTTYLFLADSNHTYVVDADTRIMYSGDMYENPDSVPPVAQFTGDSMLVAGVMCYAFRVNKPNDKITYYISPQYHVELGFFAGKDNAKANFLSRGLYGCIPLLTLRENSRRTIEIRAGNIARKALPSESFTIPRGWEVSKMRYYKR
jgi:hypothetical protein